MGRGGIRHRLRVVERVRQRLLAQHVLAGGEQCLDDLAVQRVGDDHADDLHVVGGEQLAPVGAVPLVAVARRGVGGRGLARVDDRRVVDRGERGVEQGRGRAVAGAVRPPRHAGTDHGHTDGLLGHRRLSLSTSLVTCIKRFKEWWTRCRCCVNPLCGQTVKNGRGGRRDRQAGRHPGARGWSTSLERAGVSTATASLVLRGRPGPSEATADAVRAAAADLGYRPDRTASLLARHRSHLLGVLLDVTSPFHAELVRALDTRLGDRGLELVLSTMTPRPDEAQAVETLIDFRCEALVLLGPQMPDADLDRLGVVRPPVVASAGPAAPGARGARRGRPGTRGGRRPPRRPRARADRVRRRPPRQHRDGPPQGLPGAMRRHGLGDRARRRARWRDRGGGGRCGRPVPARRPPATGRRQWCASTTGARSGCATPSSARGCGAG